MSSDPIPLDLVRGAEFVEFPPKILVFNRLPVFGAPTFSLPSCDPGSDPAAQILRISEELNFARCFEQAQGGDRGLQLHAIVGGGWIASGNLLLVSAVL